MRPFTPWDGTALGSGIHARMEETRRDPSAACPCIPSASCTSTACHGRIRSWVAGSAEEEDELGDFLEHSRSQVRWSCRQPWLGVTPGTAVDRGGMIMSASG